ncbi:hypothetical protein MTBUT4_590022 [Magnetospirillum sp. UT-4]|nr:hypothetical protein MTBUT4_590022 [Magnetospirillum sp. UT-4]
MVGLGQGRAGLDGGKDGEGGEKNRTHRGGLRACLLEDRRPRHAFGSCFSQPRLWLPTSRDG